jgi:hypothetical protein
MFSGCAVSVHLEHHAAHGTSRLSEQSGVYGQHISMFTICAASFGCPQHTYLAVKMGIRTNTILPLSKPLVSPSASLLHQYHRLPTILVIGEPGKGSADGSMFCA